MNNYRPISILSVAAKIVEKLAFDELYTYVDQKGNLSPISVRFLTKAFYQYSIIQCDGRLAWDKGYFVGVVTLDLQKGVRYGWPLDSSV